MTRLFDAYIIVDWSAASTPKTGANSIWIGTRFRSDQSGQYEFRSENPATRSIARDSIYKTAQAFMARGDKVLIGFDFAMGYPAGTAEALGLTDQGVPAWRAMFDHLAGAIEDQPNNTNNRFTCAAEMNAKMSGRAHPFWGATKRATSASLAMTKGDFRAAGSIAEHRRAERWIRENFAANPKSVWQLMGIGSVGSQSLLGLPVVADLRAKIDGAQIWPFETGWQSLTAEQLKNTSCVLAEIYPSTVSIAPKPGEIHDESQVRTLSEHFESLDSTGELAAAFGPPDSISDGEIHKITAEEGWILAK